MMKTATRNFIAFSSLALAAGSANAASIVHDSTTLISENTAFNVSVYDGKASYAGTGGTFGSVTGTFGDGTVEAYNFFTTDPGAPFPGAIQSYVTGGSSVTGAANAAHTNGDLDNGDLWTTNDPGTGFSGGDPANFGGTTETNSGGHEVSGTIDISTYTSGTVYVLLGGYDNPFDLALNFNGESTVAMPTVDPGPTRNMYVAQFSFDDASNDYTSIDYSYTGSVGNRSVFMGVVVDAVPEPSSMSLVGLGVFGLLLRRRR